MDKCDRDHDRDHLDEPGLDGRGHWIEKCREDEDTNSQISSRNHTISARKQDHNLLVTRGLGHTATPIFFLLERLLY